MTAIKDSLSIIFNNLSVLFAMGVAYGVSKKEKGIAVFSAIISYFVLFAGINTYLKITGALITEKEAMSKAGQALVLGIQVVRMDNFGSNIFEEISNEVNRTLKIQDKKEIEKTVKQIIQSKVVYVVSRGSLSHFGEYLNSRLAICKIKSIFIRDTNLLDIIIEHMTSEEILILLSQSGNTKIIVDIAAKANTMGLKMIGITSFGKNELQKHCTNNLYFYANETDTRHYDAVLLYSC